MEKLFASLSSTNRRSRLSVGSKPSAADLCFQNCEGVVYYNRISKEFKVNHTFRIILQDLFSLLTAEFDGWLGFIDSY